MQEDPEQEKEETHCWHGGQVQGVGTHVLQGDQEEVGGIQGIQEQGVEADLLQKQVVGTHFMQVGKDHQVETQQGEGTQLLQGSHEHGGQEASFEDEGERVNAVKICNIREQQDTKCPLCHSSAIQHRLTSQSHGQKFSYICCSLGCNMDNLKTAKAFNLHMVGQHSDGVQQELSRVEQEQFQQGGRSCPLCSQLQVEHKNRQNLEEGDVYKCCQCTVSELTNMNLFVHLENHVSKKWNCLDWGKGFSYNHLLDTHTWKEHGEGQHIRNFCNWQGCEYSSKYKQTLQSHVRQIHHGIRRKRKRDYKKVQCPTCNKTLSNWYYQEVHKTNCSDGRSLYPCKTCGKEDFINVVTLKNHIRSKHTTDRPYSCEHCPMKYATAMSLSGHMSRRHGVTLSGKIKHKELFTCEHCTKSLTSKGKLQAHINVIHNGKRDFKCQFCDKNFTSKSNLQIHEGSHHTGVLPYHCDICQNIFTRRDKLRSHKKAKHPSNTFHMEPGAAGINTTNASVLDSTLI